MKGVKGARHRDPDTTASAALEKAIAAPSLRPLRAPDAAVADAVAAAVDDCPRKLLTNANHSLVKSITTASSMLRKQC